MFLFIQYFKKFERISLFETKEKFFFGNDNFFLKMRSEGSKNK